MRLSPHQAGALLSLILALLIGGAAAALPPRPAAAQASCPAQVKLGAYATCGLGAVGERDTFTLTAAINQRIVVRMTKTAGAFYPQIELQDSTGGRVTGCYSDGGTSAGFVCNLTTSGTFTIEVGDYYNAQTGTYQLYVQNLSNPGSTQALTYGQVTSSNLAVGIESDVFKFTAAINDKLLIRLRRTAGQFYPAMTVFNQAGDEVCYDDGQPLAALECTISESGTFSLFINDYYLASTGNYQLFIERIGRAVAATQIELGRSYSGSISTPIEVDTYRFTAKQNDVIFLRAQRNTGNMYVRLAVYDADGDQVCYDDGNPLAVVEPCTIEADDQYTIFIDDYYVASTGEYRLHTQRVNNPGQPRALAFGAQLSDAISPVASFDTFAFQAKAQDIVTLTMSRSAGAFYPRIRVFDPSGVRVCYADGSPTATVRECALEDNGRFTVVVDDYYLNSTGNYTLRLSCNSGICGPAASIRKVYLPTLQR